MKLHLVTAEEIKKLTEELWLRGQTKWRSVLEYNELAAG
jgi:hypothetical protein